MSFPLSASDVEHIANRLQGTHGIDADQVPAHVDLLRRVAVQLRGGMAGLSMHRVHDIKCWPEPFKELVTGRKTFELRRADRPYEVGDELLLREWAKPGRFTGRRARARIVGVHVDVPDSELPWSGVVKSGWCILSIRIQGAGCGG